MIFRSVSRDLKIMMIISEIQVPSQVQHLYQWERGHWVPSFQRGDLREQRGLR